MGSSYFNPPLAHQGCRMKIERVLRVEYHPQNPYLTARRENDRITHRCPQSVQDVPRAGAGGGGGRGAQEPGAPRLPRRGGRARRQLRDRARGVRRLHRAERGRQDDDAQGAVGAAAPDVGRGARARLYALGAPARLSAAHQHGARQQEPDVVGHPAVGQLQRTRRHLPRAARRVQKHAGRAGRVAGHGGTAHQAGAHLLWASG